jgi:hypothetical protein
LVRLNQLRSLLSILISAALLVTGTIFASSLSLPYKKAKALTNLFEAPSATLESALHTPPNSKILITGANDSAGNNVNNGGTVVSLKSGDAGSVYNSLTFTVQFSSTLLKDNPNVGTNAWTSKTCVIDGKSIDFYAPNNPCGTQDWGGYFPPNLLTKTEPLVLKDNLGSGSHTLKIQAVEYGDPYHIVQSSNTFSWTSEPSKTMIPTSSNPNLLNGKIGFGNINDTIKTFIVGHKPVPSIFNRTTTSKNQLLSNPTNVHIYRGGLLSDQFQNYYNVVTADIKCSPSCVYITLVNGSLEYTIVHEGDRVTLDGSGSSPPGGTYSWTGPGAGSNNQQATYSFTAYHSPTSATASDSLEFWLKYCKTLPAPVTKCDSKAVFVTVNPRSGPGEPKQAPTHFGFTNLLPYITNNNHPFLSTTVPAPSTNNNPPTPFLCPPGYTPQGGKCSPLPSNNNPPTPFLCPPGYTPQGGKCSPLPPYKTAATKLFEAPSRALEGLNSPHLLNSEIFIAEAKDSSGNIINNGEPAISLRSGGVPHAHGGSGSGGAAYNTLTFTVRFNSSLELSHVGTNAWIFKQCIIDGRAVDFSASNNPCGPGPQDWGQYFPPHSLVTTEPLILKDNLAYGRHTLKIQGIEYGDPNKTLQSSNTFSWISQPSKTIIRTTLNPLTLNGIIGFNNTNKPSLLTHPPAVGSLAKPQSRISAVTADIKCLPSCQVYQGTKVTLDGSGSSPPGGTYSWSSNYYYIGDETFRSSEAAPSLVASGGNESIPSGSSVDLPFNLKYCYPYYSQILLSCDSKSVDLIVYGGSPSTPKQTRTPTSLSSLFASPAIKNNPSSPPLNSLMGPSGNNNNQNNNPPPSKQQQLPSSASQNNPPPPSNNTSSSTPTSSSNSGNNGNNNPQNQSPPPPSSSSNNNNQQQINPCVLNPETPACTPR